MPFRLLAIDLPPLVCDLVRNALTRNDGEGVFVDLPAGGTDLNALAVAARADAILAALDPTGWPPDCRPIVARGGLPLYGLDCDTGRGRIRQLRTVQTCRTDLALDDLTIDELIHDATAAGTRPGD